MPDYPLDDLREARQQRDCIEATITELVRIARGKGYSWARIAQTLRMSGPGAWARYRHLEEPHRPTS